MLKNESPESLLASLTPGTFCFLTVVSFEERASAWAEYVTSRGMPPAEVFIFDYETKALPADRDSFLRKRCRAAFTKALAPAGLRILDHVNAFAMNSLVDLTAEVLKECGTRPLVIDISCMTRIHLLALVAALHTSSKLPSVRFCYSVPTSYGFRPEDRPGWVDVLFVPAGNRWMFKREGQSRGIILVGHDAERLSVALGELEPASGSMIYCGNPKRPDFLRRAREVNGKVERRLRHLRMPRSSGPPGATDGWSISSIDVCDFEALTTALAIQVSEAIREESPVILFPFGPKPDFLATALTLREWGVEDAWAVYPVPSCFRTTYSEGVAELQAFSVESTAEHLPMGEVVKR